MAPGATACQLCGADRPVGAAELRSIPAPLRRRIVATHGLRVVVVVGVVAVLAYALLGAALSGPPNVADPMTAASTYAISPGSTPILAGAVTGGDYVVGNFTSVQPFGANVTVSVYNTTEWADLLENGTGHPAWSSPSEGSGRIIFTAAYTDSYVVVLTNPYPTSTHLSIRVYVATQYESNVGDDGFG